MGNPNVRFIHIVVEGPSEAAFVQNMMQPFFLAHHMVISWSIIETKRTLGRTVQRGGLSRYAKAKHDILAKLSSTHFYVSTMFDLYALPGDFPGQSAVNSSWSLGQRVAHLEQALQDDIGHQRFIPYLMVYEFEALLFSNLNPLFADYGDRILAHHKRDLIRLVEQVQPEEINDTLPPSKRLLASVLGYDKVVDGVLLALEIGLETMQQRCPHFNDWIERLLALPPS